MTEKTVGTVGAAASEHDISYEELAEWSIYQHALAAEWQSDGHLYHYTELGGLKGILDSAQLWGTHVAYLNDSKEFSYGVDAMCGLIQDYAEYVKSPESAKEREADDDGELLSAIIMGVHDLVSRSKDVLEEELGPFVTCLSMARDDLNQWRGYAKGGYAIKFDPTLLKESVRQVRADRDEPLSEPVQKPSLVAVEYIPKRQFDRVRALVDQHLLKLSDAVKKGIDIDSLQEVLVQEVVPLAASLKYEKFVGEAEHRLISHCSETFYSPSPFGLIPRVRFGFSREAVKAVVVGPGEFADVKKLSLERYLRRNYPHAVVIPSDVPYREV